MPLVHRITMSELDNHGDVSVEAMAVKGAVGQIHAF
jgi:hypothetical protein